MSHKKNTMAPAGLCVSPGRVKYEPNDNPIIPLNATTAWQTHPQPQSGIVKPEFVEVPLSFSLPNNSPHVHTQNVPPSPVHHFTVYKSAEDISYVPELALKEGVRMVKAIKENAMKLDLGSKMRKEVWLREIAGLESQGAPTTLIAVCGATGAGKSSLLNAILDNNIVPTSGMRACTAVVTEISFHDKPTIDADISFLSVAEWREELQVLLDDLLDEDGNIRRTTDLRNEAGIAWHKVHAVYPSIDQDQLAGMTADQIIARDPIVANYLGTVQHICAKDSKTFGNEITKYIDSKDQKRGKNSKKEKKGGGGHKDKKKDGKRKDPLDGPALWPLIRQVQVKCKSNALSTGAVLVDLPGVADANTARSNICKDYMKKCNCIWVLAPITRAVDDRTAKDLLGDAFKIQLRMDGNYDDNAITFVATKADDISCNEVVRALGLVDDEEIQEIDNKIDIIKEEQKNWKRRQIAATKAAKATEQELKEIRAIGGEYQEHLKALEEGREFQPKLTVRRIQAVQKSPFRGKRKRSGHGNKKMSKRHKSNSTESDSFMNNSDQDELDSFMSESDVDESDDTEDDIDESSDSLNSGSLNESDSDSDSGSEAEETGDEVMEIEKVTKESLKAKIEGTQTLLKAARERLTMERQEKKNAYDEAIKAKDRLTTAQVEKNGICSLKRSEFSRDVLKEDFRTGLREIDEADAEERDPDNFDPSKPIRNYDEIDLPTFCASARDYIRITKQMKGDGDPTCFTKVEDTGIPALQAWCHYLTVSSRQRAARNFFSHLQTFVKSIWSYVRGITEIKEEDRKALQDLWESQIAKSDDDDDEGSFDPFTWLRHEAWSEAGDRLLKKKQTEFRTDIRGRPLGITNRLAEDLETIVEAAVEELKNGFEDGLNEKLQVGAANAAMAAMEISDTFAASMPWQTYRATLRRDGSFRRCLNTELITPLTKNIASSWAKVFEANLFASFEARAMTVIKKLLQEIETSAAPGLKDRTKSQSEIALEEAKVAMKALVTVVREILDEQQKDISRCLVPHLQEQLKEGYILAMEERGLGSVKRQKTVFHNFIEDVRHHIFNGGADTLLERLNTAADSVGNALDDALGDVAQKIEVAMSMLWESPRDDPRQDRARREALETLRLVEEQIALWTTAAEMKESSSSLVANST